MKFPRFSHGGFGKLDYKVLNQAFDLLETVGTDPFNSLTNDKEHRETFVARIIGLTTSATQGASQSGTETVTDGVFIKAYLYDWEEVDIGVGDGASPAGSGTGVSSLSTKTNKGSASNTSEFVTDKGYYPAIDFSPMRQYAANTIVLLTKSLVRTGSKYSHMYVITPLATSFPFLARLTSVVGTVGAGRYEWTGLSRLISGTSAEKTEATNLYEKNRVSTPGSTTALSVNGTSWDGSGNWGHGQSLSQAGSTLTKLQLPTGIAGVGTVVIMHQSHVLESSAGTAFYFYCVAPVSAVCA
ncbi:hypothetical protein UFOVP1575_11 [uncultured Caudovirales phage]|uniref:Uncharacterized protein n=1 Tax=uncultured Caudovirales phage TaxID=2100421 RepID=A0A6J5SQC9_9CAUD|nr:hypothetical protein UFOVP1128_32 [uncultured Caudovirales phage]CAB4192201.1 hypothetical protein UFOVP1237_14 [uncultured Caudovirales phage]CAB4216311.1 hypothetical protein UFOVP1489_6 [uncultured Caudovirales phage]CAB5230395.1 hypothetical protein UFOVP1575_11 [uncultured Caudovirales phage]